MNSKQSLQTFKADLYNKETTLKTIQKHYPHLAHLSENEILTYLQIETIDELREHIKQTLETSIAIYEDKIDGMTCSCKDSKGSLKDPYDTQELAQEQAAQSMMHQKQKLRVYPCPYGNGWHLTKG
jgi:hypothetical protein